MFIKNHKDSKEHKAKSIPTCPTPVRRVSIGTLYASKGFSLIEILIVFAVLALILEAGMGLFIIGLKDWQSKDDRMALLSNAVLVMNYLKPDITSATKITVSGDKQIELVKRKGVAVATNTGVFCYSEQNPAGAGWNNIANNLPSGVPIISLLESDNHVLFAGTSDGRVYKTIDSGQTWTATASLSGATGVQCLLESGDNTTVYAGTTPYGDVFKTTDEGVNWINTGNLTSGGTDATSILSLTEDQTGILYAGTSYINNINLFKSTDGGNSWIDCSFFNNWWDTAYSYKTQITIYNNSTSTLPSGYSVKLILNHYSLVQSGKSLSSGDDVRIVYWNGTGYVELDRINETVWNTSNTTAEIWFETQSNIPAGNSDGNYYVYYGNDSPGTPPSNRSNIYSLWDDFASLNTSIWDTSGTPTVSGGVLNLTNNTAVATKLTYSYTFLEIRLLWNATANSVRWGWAPSITSNSAPYVRWRSGGTSATRNNYYPEKNNNGGSSYTGAAVTNPLTSFAIYKIAWESGTTGATKWNYGAAGSDRTLLGVYSQNQPVVIRNVNSANTLRVDWVKIRQYISPEPTVSVSSEINRNNLSVLSLLAASGIIYAGTNTSGDVFKTTDGGVTFSNTVNLTDAGTDAVNIFSLITGTDQTVYAATGPSGRVFTTRDNGQTWQNTATLSGASDVRSLKTLSDGYIYAGTTPAGGVFRSAVPIVSWTGLPNIPSATNVPALSDISERIRYFWSGNRYSLTKSADDQLSRVFAGKTYQLEEGLVKAFQINYYKADHTSADTTTQSGRDQIKIITVTLTMEKNGREITLTNTIQPNP